MSSLSGEWLAFAVGTVAGKANLLVSGFAVCHGSGEAVVGPACLLEAFFLGAAFGLAFIDGGDDFDPAMLFEDGGGGGGERSWVSAVADGVEKLCGDFGVSLGAAEFSEGVDDFAVSSFDKGFGDPDGLGLDPGCGVGEQGSEQFFTDRGASFQRPEGGDSGLGGLLIIQGEFFDGWDGGVPVFTQDDEFFGGVAPPAVLVSEVLYEIGGFL